jgi:predicted nucleotidyltransferase
MSIDTSPSLAARELIDAHRDELELVLAKYGATNPRLFGSVARGEAGLDSDIDILVDLIPNELDSDLFRVGGLTEMFRRILGRPVDVVATQLLRERVAASAERDAIPL